MNDVQNPSIFVLYHYLPPDDVVSAVHLGDLCAGLAKRGWQVSAFPTVWGCRNENIRLAHREKWQGVQIHRIWRPRFRQSSGLGRLLNAAWMIAKWSLLAFKGRERPDILLVGTDPILSILVGRFWKVVSPRTKIVHWCFDLYPEAAIADGILSANGLLARFLGSLLRPAYRACDVIADIGPCMRGLLARYASNAQRVTRVPWALEEPKAPLDIDRAEREAVFGTSSLALLYSGNFGRAHGYGEILELIDKLTAYGAQLAFSVRGNREAELREEVSKRRLDVRFVPFAAEERLAARLACPDVHVVSLRSEWTGMVVPSKFFGALSVGRPVLFSGSTESAVGQWIRLFKVGWVLSGENIDEVAAALVRYSRSPEEQRAMRENCFQVYQQHFSKHTQIEGWHSLLRSLLTARHPLDSERTNEDLGGSYEIMSTTVGNPCRLGTEGMYIVTGGAGFIGSNLVHELNRYGISDILVVDNLADPGKQFNLHGAKFTDYMDKREFRCALKQKALRAPRIRAIFHQGACSNTLLDDGVYMMDNNFTYSKEIFDFALEQNSPLVYASTAAVYGLGGPGHFSPSFENEKPLNIYGFSKLAFDNYVRHKIGQTSMPITVVGLRYFNVYGPREAHKGRMASVIHHFSKQIRENRKVRLFEGSGTYGNGEQRRDFVFVRDLALLNLYFAQVGPYAPIKGAARCYQGVVNAGSGRARTFNEVATALMKVYGEAQIEYVPFPADLKKRYQHFTEADLTELRAMGCDLEFTFLEEGVSETFSEESVISV